MNTYADKRSDSTREQAATHEKGSKESGFQLPDNRPEAIAQRKLREMVNPQGQETPLQLKLATTAAGFDSGTTIKRFMLSDYRLPNTVEALRNYETANTKEKEMTGLLRIKSACDAEYQGAQEAQKSKITDLRFELLREARAILPDVILSRLGTPSLLTESLAISTRNANLYAALGIQNNEYQQEVDKLVVFKNSASGNFKSFLATNPDAKDTKSAFITSFRKHLTDNKKYITTEAVDDIDDEIKKGWERQKARGTDKENLRGLFDIGDDMQVMPAENRVSKAEFERLALMYSQIRENDSKIKFVNKTRTGGQQIEDNQMSDQELQSYKIDALADITKILRTGVGRDLLTSLHQGGKTGTSEFKLGGVSNPNLAGAGADDDNLSSNGTGSGGTVYYQPGADLVHTIATEQNKVFTSDTTLFHELTHAYHSGQGTKIPSDQLLDFADIVDLADIGVKKEEYATVGLGAYSGSRITENAYRAAHTKLAGGNQTIKDKYKPRLSYN